jgi:hypothetical protein
MKTGHVLVLLILAAMMCYACVGCATFEVYELDKVTGEMVLVKYGQSAGFLRNMSIVKQYDAETGNLIGETVTTQSSTPDLLLGVNEVLGTLFTGASKAMP